MRFRCSSKIAIYKIEDSYIALDISCGIGYSLNYTAAWLLSKSNDFISLQDILELAKKQYQLQSIAKSSEEIKQSVFYLAGKDLLEVDWDEHPETEEKTKNSAKIHLWEKPQISGIFPLKKIPELIGLLKESEDTRPAEIVQKAS